MMTALFETRASENKTSPTKEREHFIGRIPLGELGSVEDVARAYRYFSSNASGYITGQHLIVDGGWQVG
jgi:NAD(P)-dependent dehydrogenase (short-subunit alcohol dehydrogenase family)